MYKVNNVPGTNIKPGIKLSENALYTTFVKNNNENQMSKIKIPLTLMLCQNNNCGLIQLKETVQPDLLYQNYYMQLN